MKSHQPKEKRKLPPFLHLAHMVLLKDVLNQDRTRATSLSSSISLSTCQTTFKTHTPTHFRQTEDGTTPNSQNRLLKHKLQVMLLLQSFQWLPIPNPLTLTHKTPLDLVFTSPTIILYYPPYAPPPPHPTPHWPPPLGQTHPTLLPQGFQRGNAVPLLLPLSPAVSFSLRVSAEMSPSRRSHQLYYLIRCLPTPSFSIHIPCLIPFWNLL